MMSKERFTQTNFKMSYAEHRACDCTGCDKKDCIHRECYRRVPQIDGGLGLCPNLKFVPVINDLGVLVERNGTITDYRTLVHAVRALQEETEYSGDELIAKIKGKVYVIL